MQTNRNIRKSLQSAITTTFTTFGITNIYSEDQMRATWQGTFTPVNPYIYFTDEFTVPQKTTLPTAILEINKMEGNAFEIGNRAGREFETSIHFFGQTRGQREDFASYFQDNFPHGVTIYDYTSGSAGASTLGKIEMIDDSPTVVEEHIPDSKIEERSIYNWNRVTWRSRVLG